MLEERINKEKAWFRIWSYLFAGAVLLVLIFGAAGLVYLPWLRFKDIKVEGNNRVESADIIRRLIGAALHRPFAKYLGYTNMLLWGMDNSVAGTPLIARIDMARDWFQREIVITVHERERYAIWCPTGVPCVWVDGTGMALEVAPVSEGHLVDVIYSNDPAPIRLGGFVSEENTFLYFKKVLDAIAAAHLNVSRVDYNSTIYEVTAKVSSGTNLSFSLRFDPGFTIAPLSSIAGRSDFSRMEYVDFRIENRVYYK